MKIGVDGGGTKTELILIDDQGKIVARATAPGCNPSIAGPDSARETLLTALRGLRTACSSPIARTLLCMAGSPSFWRETASSISGYGSIETVTDALPVLELATAGQPGLALHAGTGSFVILRDDEGTIHTLGGLGWRVGDPGSAHDIGRRALGRALAEMQGWSTPSPVGELIAEAFSSHDAAAITAALYRDAEPNRRITGLAGKLAPLAQAGEGVARTLVLDSAKELLATAVAAATRFLGQRPPGTLRAGLSGPILTQSFVVQALSVLSPFALEPITESPIEGVRRLLARDQA